MQKENKVSELNVFQEENDGITPLIKTIIKEKQNDETKSAEDKEKLDYKLEIVWGNVIIGLIIHMLGFYGLYLSCTAAKIQTLLFRVFIIYVMILGTTAGTHRLWAHRSYKATLPMRIILMLIFTCANQFSIYYWARDHRVHHKYVDTNADPYNSKRGFFFSHVGWLMARKHPDVTIRGKQIDMSDITNDPVVVFQKKYYLILMPIVSIILPTWIPMYFWNETLKVSFFTIMWGYVYTLHVAFSGNSFFHMWGSKTFNRFISAMDNPFIGFIWLGENWHNYHHTFPWDYKIPEIPFSSFHPIVKFIEFCALFGLTYDLKSVSLDLVKKQAERKGDGSFKKFNFDAVNSNNNHSHKSTVWGWDDLELEPADRDVTEIH